MRYCRRRLWHQREVCVRVQVHGRNGLSQGAWVDEAVGLAAHRLSQTGMWWYHTRREMYQAASLHRRK